MAEGEGPEIASQGASRRDVLKGILAGTGLVAAEAVAGGTAAYVVENKTSGITRLFEPEAAKIPRAVPPQLEGIPIPESNEHYRTPLHVIQSALSSYEQSGGKPFYKLPEEYLTQFDATKLYVKGDILGQDVKQNNIISFSAITFFTFDGIYDVDPGTSVKEQVAQQIALLQEPDLVANETGAFGPTQKEVTAAKVYCEFFNRTRTHIDQLRNGGRVSTEELLKYYLHENQGDIVKSMWDSVLFLKMAARVEASVLEHPEDFMYKTNATINTPSRKNAEILSSMFYDDFSTEVPLEWLLSAVKKDDKELNTDDQLQHQEWKDFMPVNRAGTPYHVFNLATWAGVMDPALVEEITTVYYAPIVNSRNSPDAHGRIKVQADYTTARQAREIREVFEKYKQA